MTRARQRQAFERMRVHASEHMKQTYLTDRAYVIAESSVRTRLPLSSDCLLQQGSILKNTDWVLGVAVCTLMGNTT